MKELILCIYLWIKRVIKRPVFVLMLLVMPAMVLFLNLCHSDKDSMVHIGIHAVDKQDNLAKDLLRYVESISNESVRFDEYTELDKMRADVSSGVISCGYILPHDFEDSMEKFFEEDRPFIKSIKAGSGLTAHIVDGIVMSRIYERMSLKIVEDFLIARSSELYDEDWVREKFEENSAAELLFDFEYVDGTENEMLNNASKGISVNYMLMPIRGIVSVIVLAVVMAGGLLWFQDCKCGITYVMTKRKRRYWKILSMVIPGLYAGIVGVASIIISGLCNNVFMEIGLMAVHIMNCTIFSMVFINLCRKYQVYMAVLPLITVCAFVFCPVFVDVSMMIPALGIIGRLLPPLYYLRAEFSSQYVGLMFGYTVSGVVLYYASSVIWHWKEVSSRDYQ